MATKTWLGAASARAQIDTLTVGSSTAAQTFTVTINGKTVTYLAVTGETTTTVASGLQALLAASADGEFQKINWTADAAVITATANTPGEPFTITVGGTGTLTLAHPTTNSSPNDLNDTANWSGGTKPVNSDSVFFENTDIGAYWNLESALSGVSLAALTVRDTFTDRLANPDYDTGGSTFREYRGTTFTLTGCTTLEVTESDQAQAGAFRWNVGAVQCALKLYGAGNGAVGSEVNEWRGTHASNTLDVIGGSVAVAIAAGQAATIAGLQAAKGGVIRLGSGVTLTSATVELTDSTLDTRSGGTGTTLVLNGDSTATIRDAASWVTVKVDQGTLNHMSTGTITTLKVGSNGVADFSGVADQVTVTNCTLEEGATLNDPLRRVIWTNGITLNRTEISKVTINVGTHVTLTVAAGP